MQAKRYFLLNIKHFVQNFKEAKGTTTAVRASNIKQGNSFSATNFFSQTIKHQKDISLKTIKNTSQIIESANIMMMC